MSEIRSCVFCRFLHEKEDLSLTCNARHVHLPKMDCKDYKPRELRDEM